MNKITLLSLSSFGDVIFLVEKDKYYYQGIDGLIIEKIKRTHYKRSGDALNMAKQYCSEWKKNDGEWKKRGEK